MSYVVFYLIVAYIVDLSLINFFGIAHLYDYGVIIKQLLK